MGRNQKGQFTDRDKQRIAVALVFIFLIIVGDVVAGFLGVAAHGQKESGYVTCTWPTLTSQNCGTSVVFPTSFINIPTVSLAVNGTFPGSRLLLGSPEFITASTTWTAMPAATTEFLGGTANRLNFSNIFQGNIILHARVLTGDASATAALQLQKDTDGTGNTWSNVVGATLTFGTGIGDFFSVISSPQSPTMTNGIEFRIVGSGGDGVSSPVFQYIYFENLRTQTGGTAFYGQLTTNGFSLTLTLPGFPIVLGTASIEWVAESP